MNNKAMSLVFCKVRSSRRRSSSSDRDSQADELEVAYRDLAEVGTARESLRYAKDRIVGVAFLTRWQCYVL
eukprot:scaffold452104_cov22-Prasinocladus_malaysianus.AAC.1